MDVELSTRRSHRPLVRPPLPLVASFGSQHGGCAPAPAAPLTSTLDHRHGEKTPKEINLAARAFSQHGLSFGALDLIMLYPDP